MRASGRPHETCHNVKPSGVSVELESSAIGSRRPGSPPRSPTNAVPPHSAPPTRRWPESGAESSSAPIPFAWPCTTTTSRARNLGRAPSAIAHIEHRRVGPPARRDQRRVSFELYSRTTPKVPARTRATTVAPAEGVACHPVTSTRVTVFTREGTTRACSRRRPRGSLLSRSSRHPRQGREPSSLSRRSSPFARAGYPRSSSRGTCRCRPGAR